ncbi:MAG TPA: PDZ domain-containing protein [Vicinamibacteria bacterium]|nr:PDZ domain-containing protein [Vicinamibacteria bacterium]
MDGKSVGGLKANDEVPKNVGVTVGPHKIVALSSDGKLRWQETREVKAGPQAVLIRSKDAKAVYSAEDFDRLAARVWIGIADLKLAGEYAASILDKSWGFHDQNLALALHTAHEYLKQQVEDLKTMDPPESARKRMVESVLKIAAATDKYIDLMSKAITEAQKTNSWMGTPNDLYSQARALEPTLVLPPEALAVLKTSTSFTEAVPLEHRQELGLAADARDFDLGAKSFQSTPNMLAVVTKGGLAHELGFRAGDRLVSANGQPVSSIWDLKLVMNANMAKKIRVVFEREGKREVHEIKIPARIR